MNKRSVKRHLDSLTGNHPTAPNPNGYPHPSLKKFIAEVIPAGSHVLEVGTATGEILNFLRPSIGTGIDLSSDMIRIARSKFAQYNFECVSLKDFRSAHPFDYILLADVIGYSENPERLFPKLLELSGLNTRIVVITVNPAWGPPPKFFVKMKEGVHFGIPEKDIVGLAEMSGFYLVSKKQHLLFSTYIPRLPTILDNGTHRPPFFRRPAVIQRFVFEKALAFHERRIASEIDHGRKIAPQAEKVWNWEGPINRVRYARRIRFLSEGLKPEICALELGCGTGLFTEGLSKTGADLISIDISPDLLEKARRRLPTGKFLEKDACQTGFPDGYFDAVIGSSVLHHLDIKKTLREIRRILKTGGRIRFTEPNLLNPHVFLELKIPCLRKILGVSEHETAFVRHKLSNTLRESGFAEIRVEPFDFLYPFLPDVFLPLLEQMDSVLQRIPIVREISGSLQITAAKC